MTKKQVEIVNKTGLHARPASDFVLEAKKYESKITICRENGVPVNAKSVVRILAEGIGQGTKIEIAAEGTDEEQAAASLAALVESGLENKGGKCVWKKDYREIRYLRELLMRNLISTFPVH